jgi:hypothetical protein
VVPIYVVPIYVVRRVCCGQLSPESHVTVLQIHTGGRGHGPDIDVYSILNILNKQIAVRCMRLGGALQPGGYFK